MAQSALKNPSSDLDDLGERHRAASQYFEHWPQELTVAEQSLRAQLQTYASFDAMLYVYVLHRGKVFKPAPLPAGVKAGQARQCFQNAAELATEFPDEYAYVEGYGLSTLATAHAWCVTRDGIVVDPTWKDPAQCAYVGIPMDLDFVTMRVLKTGVWGVFGEMAERATLQEPISAMVHPWWRDEIAARGAWPRLEAALQGKLKA